MSRDTRELCPELRHNQARCTQLASASDFWCEANAWALDH